MTSNKIHVALDRVTPMSYPIYWSVITDANDKVVKTVYTGPSLSEKTTIYTVHNAYT